MNNVGDIVLPDLKICCKAIIIKMVQYWNKSKHKDKWNTLEI